MQHNKQYYKRLDRDRQRTLVLGFNLGGVPVDDDHEEFIERQEREAREYPQQPVATTASKTFLSSPPSHGKQRQQDYSPREDRSFSGSYGSSPSEQGNLSVTTTNSNQEEAERSITFQDRHGPGEILAKNVWPILLYFEDKRQWEGKVLLDSGAIDNWISERTVRENGFPRDDDEDDEESYEDFSGGSVKSCGVVRAQWIFRHQTIPVKFKIAPNAPWEVLFGYRHLIETNVITLNYDSTNRWVAPLIKNTRKPGPGEYSFPLQSSRSAQTVDLI